MSNDDLKTLTMNQEEKYCISFSGGRTSAFMTIELLKDERYKDAVVLFSNTGKENEATLEFVNEVDKLIGGRIVWVEYDNPPDNWFNVVTFETASRNGEPFAKLIKKRKYLPNRVARFCTQDLKIKTMKKYLQSIGWRHWVNLVGIRYDEPRRWNKSKSVERNEIFAVEHPLVKWKITKQDVLDYWKNMPFDLNLKEHEGNCDLCFLKGMKKKQMIARDSPEKFDWWIEQEKNGSTFVNGITYAKIRDYVIKSPQFDLDDSIECFCNID